VKNADSLLRRLQRLGREEENLELIFEELQNWEHQLKHADIDFEKLES